MLSTPIINPPQSGILGMHNIIERPIAVNGVEIDVCDLSYDYWVDDGVEVVVERSFRNPMELLLDNNPKKAFEL
jgi:2-oxoglutarate dehydrogenase E2 component (dihydrolipoamide succinyltransferase)